LAPVELAGIQYSLDTQALLFAVLLTVGTGVLFGLFPALHSARPDLVSALKGSSGRPSGSRATTRFRSSVATAQIALSTALLILAGLCTRSLINASHADLGFRADNLLTFSVSPRLNGYSRDQSVALYERIEDALRALPGVISITASNVGVFAGDETAELWETPLRVQGFPYGIDVDTNARWANVGADYFRTLGIPLLSGRDFTQGDTDGTPRVAVVNETFVQKFKLGHDAIDKQIGVYGGPVDTAIVGVARDAKYSEIRAGIQPEFFLPYRQRFEFSDNTFYVRVAGNPARVLAAIPPLMAGIDSNVPVDRLRAMPEQMQAYITLIRVTGILSAVFASLATLLAAIGLYGVLAYSVAQRTKEFGVRMALGADRAQVQYMVLERVAWMTGIGGVIGFAAALALARVGESLLYQLNARDPLVLGVSGILMLLVTFAAGLIPARRASRLDPLTALRYE
jgi:predicted permease